MLASGLLTMAALLVAGGGSFRLSFWRPVEIFGDGLAFQLNSATLPLALLATALASRGRAQGSSSELSLLQLTVTLAAIAADNLLTVVISWSILALWGNWSERNLWMLAAVAPLFAAAALTGVPDAGLEQVQFVALAALLLGRSIDRPYLMALPAFALLSRLPLAGPGVLLFGAGAVVLATLGGRRWLPAGVIGFALLAAGLQTGASEAGVLAGALTLGVVGSLDWLPSGVRRWVGGLLVGGLPLQVALLAAGQSPSLLTIPAAALLAAPVIGGTRRRSHGVPENWAERSIRALPAAASGAVLISSIERINLGAAVYGLGAVALAALMAAGPRWLYRQPGYMRLAGSLLGVVGRWLSAVLRGLTAAARAANRVLEGESSTVWLFVILLIVAQAVAG